MRGSPTAMAIVLLAGCTGPGEATEEPVSWPERKPYQVEGREGNIVLARLDRPENPTLDAFGVFGDSLQGFLNPAACVADFMPCVGYPRLPYGEVAFLSNTVFFEDGTTYDWVGDEILVGSTIADFAHDPTTGLANYHGQSVGRPNGSYRIRLGGEWTNLEQVSGYLYPDFQVYEPALSTDQRLDLSGPPITFRWNSLGGREIWLWAQGDYSRRLIRVPDIGEYTLEPYRLGLGPAEKVEIGLAAVTQESMDVDGNQLSILSLAGSGWTGSVCGDFLDVPIEESPRPTTQMESPPVFFGYGFNGIIDGGVRDFYDPGTGEPRSAELYFSFYDESFQEVCRIRYDASDAARREPLILDSEAEQYATFRVSLLGGDSTCGLVDPELVGYADLRVWLEQYDWSFSIGDVTELAEPLENAFGEEGWSNQGRFLYSTFWSQDGLFGQERGYGYNTAMPTCFQGSLSAAYYAPEDEINDAYYFSYPYFIDRL